MVTAKPSSNESTYQYQPLERDDSIRLITLLPTISKSGSLQCNINHVLLSSKPEYEALSYAWGDPADVHTIYCDGRGLSISKNLYEALLNRRGRFGKTKIWADAVCINQNDIPERNNQVRIMSRIYSQAKIVQIWLGGKDKDDKLVMKSLMELYAKSLVQIGSPPEVHMFLPKLKDEGWAALQKFLDRPWWARAWIIQEAVLASKAQFIWGEQSVPWNTIVTSIVGLGLFKMAAKLGHLPHAIITAPFIQGLRNYRKDPGRRKKTLVDILEEAREQKATDPRDKVFALVGLSMNPLDQQYLVPDYARPVEDIYIDLAIHFITRLKDLRILSFACPAALELPSWVPDWSIPSPGVLRPAAAHFQAGGSHLPITHLSPDCRSITLHGYTVTQISKLGQDPPTSRTFWAMGNDDLAKRVESSYNANRAWLNEARDLSTSYSPDPYLHPTQSRAEAFTRTLICDTNPASERATPDDIKYAPDFLHRSQYPLWRALEACSNALNRTADEFLSLILLKVSGKRFCITAEGRMGWVPRQTVMGDCIVLFKGAEEFHVLRPVAGDRFRVVGMCYLHGLMHGEFLEEPDVENSAREFCLV